MSAERGAQNSEEVRSLLRIWGGEGEREDPPADPPADAPVDKLADETDEDESSSEAPADDSKPGEKSLEDQLDDEKRARIKAERELAKQAKAVEDAEADKDAVKDRDKYKARVDKRDAFITEKLLIWEINNQKKFDFIDVDDVIRAFKGDEVQIDLDADEPTVSGLDLALKRIAKEKPHFLKKAKEDGDDNDGQPSGSKVGGGKPESAEAEAKRLGEKFRIPGMHHASSRPL